MALFTRKDVLPAEVRASLALAPRDSVLGQAPLADGGWALATRHRVLVTTPAHTTAVDRHWYDVDRARWDPDTDTLHVQWVDGTPPTPLVVATKRTEFLRAFRERVQSSIVLTETVPLPRGSSARVAVRRAPDDELFVQVVGDEGADLTSPDAAAVVGRVATRLAGASGAPVGGC